MSLTSPLGLMRHLRKPSLQMEMIPWLNVMLLGLMMYLLSSSYIWAPGLVVTNKSSTLLPKTLSLPTLPATPGTQEYVGRPDATLVITKQGTEPSQFILNYGSYTLDDLPGALKNLRKNLPGKTAVLMLKADKAVPWGTITDICVLAKSAGFDAELGALMPAGGNPASAPPAAPAPDDKAL